MSDIVVEEKRKHPGNHLPFDTESVKIRKNAILELSEKGFSLTEIAKVTGYTYNSVSSVLSRLKAKNRNDPFERLRPKAIKAIKEIVKGKAVGDAVAPRSSDVLQASSMVLERTDPIVHLSQSQSVNLNLQGDDLNYLDDILAKHYQSVDNQSQQPVDNHIPSVSD